MLVQAAKRLGAGLATIGFAGAGVGIGTAFWCCCFGYRTGSFSER